MIKLIIYQTNKSSFNFYSILDVQLWELFDISLYTVVNHSEMQGHMGGTMGVTKPCCSLQTGKAAL